MRLTISEPIYKRYKNEKSVIEAFNNNKDFIISDYKFQKFGGLACNKDEIISTPEFSDIEFIVLYYDRLNKKVILGLYDGEKK